MCAKALTRAIEDEENGLKTYQPKIDEDTMTCFLYTKIKGDVRGALNALLKVLCIKAQIMTKTVIDMLHCGY